MDLKINNKLITESIINILKQAKSEITTNKLKDIIDKKDNILITCPHHIGKRTGIKGTEAHPACQVYCGDANTLEYGYAHCYACGFKVPLPELINEIFDEHDTFGEEWLCERFGDTFIVQIPKLSKIDINKKTDTYLDESILNKYKYYHPYMFERKLTKDVIDRFKIGYNKEKDTIVFPVWDNAGKLKLLTQRSITSKHFYIDENIDKPVYLLNEIIKNNITTVYVTESQINALTCWSWGYPAVALIGTGSDTQYKLLQKSGIRHYILCFDGDWAGDKGIERFKKAMSKDIMISIKKIPRDKDVNDLNKEIFDSLPLIR